jgi:LPPG:FO 2-phospho-L-lactate transferase
VSRFRRVVFLSGGVGGARLLHGVAQALAGLSARGSARFDPGVLTAVVNTGDDFAHWGLWVCPDLDTVMYTLSELADEGRGWGLRDESFRALERMRALGAPGWFALGDRDLATHLWRSEALRAGQSLTEVTQELCARHAVGPRVLPMCDAPRATWIDTFEHGWLPFQRWLVEHRAPRVRRVEFRGEARPSPQVRAALEQADLIVIGPSNPYVSVDPLLSLEGVRELVARKTVIALSPIVAGRAVKGPLAEMIASLAGREPSVSAIVDHYGGLLSGIVVEESDVADVRGLPCLGTRTVMGGKADRLRLARELLAFAERLP